MRSNIRILVFLFLLFLHYKEASAQAVGSSNTENTARYIGGTRTTLAESLYIGPQANITVDGTWVIYSKNIVIDPNAVIQGNGRILIYNPSEVGGIASATMIDGNGSRNAIDVNIELHNAEGMELTSIPFPSDLLASGATNNASNSSVYIGKDLNLAVDGADVTLDAAVTGDLVLDADATISNYRPERMVVTNNSIVSHVVKEDLSTNFVFPIGITKGDYTPAEVTGAGTFHASVQNYTQSASDEGLLNGGPDRTWHIYADAPATATLALQHNIATDYSLFSSAELHYVTQFGGSSWSTSTPKAQQTGVFTTGVSPIVGASTQSLDAVNVPNTGNSDDSYFTKATVQSALPVSLVSITVESLEQINYLRWKTANEENSQQFAIERSNDARSWEMIGQQISVGLSDKPTSYSWSDTRPMSGINYYRLKMIDNDGSFTYSPIVSAVMKELTSFEISIYPNPAAERFYVQNVNKGQLDKGRIISTSGKIVQQFATLSDEGIDITSLPSGMYIVQLQFSTGAIQTQKIIVAK